MGSAYDAKPRSSTWELFRALAATCDEWSFEAPYAEALGLSSIVRADHTEAFVLNAPPYASIYLGAEGKLGGDASDRIIGFWRVLDLTPPNECDHLSTLLALYAYLGQTGDSLSGPAFEVVTRARVTLLQEHLWSWVPVYCEALRSIAMPWLSTWTTILYEGLLSERSLVSYDQPLPSALREAPQVLRVDTGLGDLLDSVVSPLQCGFVLTRASLRQAAAELGLGLRAGERKFVLRSMIEQNSVATLGWLADEASRWESYYRALEKTVGTDRVLAWWADRCQRSAAILLALGRQV